MRALRVLVVEDDPIIAILLSEGLTETGHDICAIVPTEAQAVDAAARCRPDLMIVDVWLAEGNGVSAVKRILSDGFVPHVFVSGDASSARELWPEAVVLQRPFREADLAGAIERALATATPS